MWMSKWWWKLVLISLKTLQAVWVFATDMQRALTLGRLLKKWPGNITHVALNFSLIHTVKPSAKFRGVFSSAWSSRLKPGGLFHQGWSVRASAQDTESFWGPSLAPLCGHSSLQCLSQHDECRLCFSSTSTCPERLSEICQGQAEPLVYNSLFLCWGWACLTLSTSGLLVEDETMETCFCAATQLRWTCWMGAELFLSLPSDSQCLWPLSLGVGTQPSETQAWLCGVLLAWSARVGPQLWNWVLGQEVQLGVFFWAHVPLLSAWVRQGFAALNEMALQPELAVFQLAGGHRAPMHAVCSPATLVKVNRQIAACAAVQMECSIKAWVSPLRASTRSPWACPLQCRGPKEILKTRFSLVFLTLPWLYQVMLSAPQMADYYVHGKAKGKLCLRSGRGDFTLILWEEKLHQEIQ